MPAKGSLQLADLNDHVLWAMLSWFPAVELLNFGLTCKRFHEATQSINLWYKVAGDLEDDGCSLPLLFGEVIKDMSLQRLRQVAIRACRLRRNLSAKERVLFRQTVLKPSWKLFKRQAIPDEAVDCLKIFDGRWIIYRRPESLCIQHIDSTKLKESYEIPIIAYAGWPFELTQVDRNTALIGIRHDVNEEWLVLEVTLGATKNDKPKTRPLPLDRAQYLRLIGKHYAIVRSRGAERLVDVYTNEQATIDPHPVGEKSYLVHKGYLFTVYSRPGGRIHISASRLGRRNEPLISSSKSKHLIRLREACVAFPPDHREAHTYLRLSPTKSQLTIWHWIPLEGNGPSGYALFVVELAYLIPHAFEGDESVEFGPWTFRSCVVEDGTYWVGKGGQSSMVSRYEARRAHLNAYPCFQIPTNDGFAALKRKCGVSLPLPDELCTGENTRAIRVTWDDVSGVAAVMFESGMIWVLHYA